jgi:hypothetical protein
MKWTDNYRAKLHIWAVEGRVIPAAQLRPIPGFRSRRFSSYEDLRQWKKKVLLDFVRAGVSPWKK